MAGPLTPQCVMSSGPFAWNFVPGRVTTASSTTNPILSVSVLASRASEKRLGTGKLVCSDMPVIGLSLAAFGHPPVATSTLSAL